MAHRGSRTHSHNSLKRASNTRDQRTIFVVSGEGQTERTYFHMSVFAGLEHVAIKLPPNTSSAKTRTNPRSVVRRAEDLERNVRRGGLIPGDQVWVVVDTDRWAQEDRRALSEFASSKPYRHVAVSNPKIELFILMHFENANGCVTAEIVDRRLAQQWAGYSKMIPSDKFTKSEITAAIKRARAKRGSNESVFPPEGCTDVYKLVEAIFIAEERKI